MFLARMNYLHVGCIHVSRLVVFSSGPGLIALVYEVALRPRHCWVTASNVRKRWLLFMVPVRGKGFVTGLAWRAVSVVCVAARLRCTILRRSPVWLLLVVVSISG